MLRTHTCGELRAEHVGKTVTLCGWVDSYRDHGGGLFVDLRDRYGMTQVVFNPPDTPPAIIDESKTLRAEYVIQVTGNVAERPAGMANPKLATGEIELRVTELQAAQQEPHAARLAERQRPGPAERGAAARAPLSRPAAARRCSRRCCCATASIKGMRDYFARPRLHRRRNADPRPQHAGRGPRLPGAQPRAATASFYALPQSPQLYKQILMMAGYDRYVQVARCFRDEDLRADRQPEFTQLDLEMSFVDADDVIGVIDGLVHEARQGGARPRREAAAAADDVRRGDGAIRPRRARPAVRPGARRLHRPRREERLPRVLERGRRRRPRAGDQRQEGRRASTRAAASTR